MAGRAVAAHNSGTCGGDLPPTLAGAAAPLAASTDGIDVAVKGLWLSPPDSGQPENVDDHHHHCYHSINSSRTDPVSSTQDTADASASSSSAPGVLTPIKQLQSHLGSVNLTISL